jgi:hypothetical protein
MVSSGGCGGGKGGGITTISASNATTWMSAETVAPLLSAGVMLLAIG